MKSRYLVLAFGLAVIISSIGISCEKPLVVNEVLHIKFNQTFPYQQYHGKAVVIRGYMSTLSPVDGRFAYLMNIPYQNCPFCVPNTTTIVNTVAVYAQKGKTFEFYDGPIEVTGTLRVEDTVDEFGYKYPFSIVDAKYSRLDTTILSANLKMYGALSKDGVINDIISVTGQVVFNAFFELYKGTLKDIRVVRDSEFDNIVQRITAISRTDYADIIAVLGKFKSFNQVVNANIQAKAYDKNNTKEMQQQAVKLLDGIYAWLNKFQI